MLIELIEEDLIASGIPAVLRGAATHYITGALFELLTWWIDSGSALTPRELETVFQELTMPVLDALRSAPPASSGA